MKKLLLLPLVLCGLASKAQQSYWEEKATTFPTTSTTTPQISYAGPNVIWAYGAPGDGSTDQYQVFTRSTDGGETWTSGNIDLGNAGLGIGDIMAISETTAYVAAWPNATGVFGGIYRTVDSGATWVKQPSASFNSGTDSFADWVHFWDASKGLAVGDPAPQGSNGYFEIYTTTDGGENWTRVASTNIPAPLDGEYPYEHNYETNSDIIWFGTNKGRIFKSTDFGASWSVGQSPVSDFGSVTESASYSMKDANNGILITNEFGFYRTTDGAATWTEDVTTLGYYRNFDISYIPGVNNTYVTTGLDIDAIGIGSSISIDDGATWIDINDLDLLDVDGGGCLVFYDVAHGLASGFTASSVEGGIWKWIEPLFATATFSNDKAFTASPNPTSGVLIIVGKDITNITVYDVLGKQVTTNNYSTLSSVEMNISSLKNGVYMVKVTNANGNASTIKFVKQ
ncbi:MAG: T9SS type A sorting domain-containing protein [Flavobacterium sp.]|nr:T9SS type A sorting domain-containing protein [Flavobacterium sp.]